MTTKTAAATSPLGRDLAALEAVLRSMPVYNEDGDQVIDFAPAGYDSGDFMSISKPVLLSLLARAFEAGKAAK